MSKICSLPKPLPNRVAQWVGALTIYSYESLGHEFESRHDFYLHTFSKKNKPFLVKFENSKSIKIFCLLFTFNHINVDRCPIQP